MELRSHLNYVAVEPIQQRELLAARGACCYTTTDPLSNRYKKGTQKDAIESFVDVTSVERRSNHDYPPPRQTTTDPSPLHYDKGTHDDATEPFIDVI